MLPPGMKLEWLCGGDDMKQEKRRKVISAVRSNSRPHVLVASDVASSSLDIKNVGLVIHFDLPRITPIYEDRSGRAGRHKRGEVVSIARLVDGVLNVNDHKILKELCRTRILENAQIPKVLQSQIIQKT
ncbi:unnamed protein product [Amoebophrya sp. A25]|nr:unnamed protein product [Amoebophrya sp. A25]|eukprot:GSA25T00025623001.1